MMQSTRKATTLAAAGTVLALAASIPATAQGGGAPVIADEQLGGTVLTIVPHIAYQSALLRVAGPNGYALTQRFEAGTPITVDLVTAGDIPRYAEESPRQSPQAAGLRAGRADDRDEIPLPDGRYAYEVHFTDTTGADHVHRGRFQIRAGAPATLVEKANGQTVAEDEAHAPTAPHATAGEMSGVGGTGEFDEQVNVHDANGNRVTHLSVESTDNPTWFVRNDDGVLELQENGTNNDGLFVTAGGDALVSNGLAIGSLTASADEGELELHRSVQETTKSIRAFENNLSLRSDSSSFFPQLTLHTDGGVGLGTGFPEDPLHVVRSDQPTIRLEDSGDGVAWRFGLNPSGAFVINDIADLGVAEMRISPTGQVFVNGTQVHPDYVFEEGYQLMELSELGRFVRENKHLPGVVSSQEAEGTIDLSSFPLQLLEKVEELTLYTIEQERRLQETSAELASVKAEFEALKSRLDGP